MNLMIIKIMIKPYDNTFTTDIFVYTDGACSNNGRENAMAGLGVYFGKSDERNISKRVCGRQTNNTAELSALIEAYKVLESEIEAGKNIVFCSDSQIALGWCTTTGEKYAKNNWTKKKGKIPNVELIKEAYGLFHNRKNIRFLKVKAHTDNKDKHSLGNEGADMLANKAIGREDCPYARTYLNVSYAKKDLVKKFGARWDPKKKKWYMMNSLSERNKLAIRRIITNKLI